MKTVYAFAAILMLFPLASKAQGNSVSAELYNKEVLKADSLSKVAKAWETRATELKDTVSMQKAEIASLKADMAAAQGSANTLTDSIASLNQQIQDFSKEKNKFDNIRFRYANGRLQLPYDKESVDQALIFFNEIQDPELRETYKSIPTCLRDYSISVEDVRKTLNKLQNSPKDYTRYERDVWKEKALDILNDDAYTRRASSYVNNVSIYYLDNILKEAKTRINHCEDPQKISFTDLINHLYL